MPGGPRIIGELTFQDVSACLQEDSILCLPLGAIEQHGPHLPLNTDVLIAEGLTRRIIDRWGDADDLWQLPTVALGLSREHDWAAGTMALSIDGFLALMRDLARAIARAFPTRNLVIVNGHGGNRGVLEVFLRDLAGDFDLNACVIHPFDLVRIERPSALDVHGGRDETSMMLVIAPELVKLERLGQAGTADAEAIKAMIIDRGTTWPWCSDDARLARTGVIGDAHAASVEFGHALIESVVVEARTVVARLRENGRRMRNTSAGRV